MKELKFSEMSMNTDNAQSNDAVIIQSATTSNENPNGNGEHAFHTEPPIIDDDADELRRNLHTGPELYMQGGLPRPRFVMLGQQGVGKVRINNLDLHFKNYLFGLIKKISKFNFHSYQNFFFDNKVIARQCTFGV